MLDTFLLLWEHTLQPLADRGAFDEAISPKSNIDDASINRLRQLRTALQPFATITRLSSTRSYPVIALSVRWLVELFEQLAPHPDTDSKSLADLKGALSASLRDRTKSIMTAHTPHMLAALLLPLEFDLSYIADRSIVVSSCRLLRAQGNTPNASCCCGPWKIPQTLVKITPKPVQAQFSHKLVTSQTKKGDRTQRHTRPLARHLLWSGFVLRVVELHPLVECPEHHQYTVLYILTSGR